MVFVVPNHACGNLAVLGHIDNNPSVFQLADSDLLINLIILNEQNPATGETLNIKGLFCLNRTRSIACQNRAP